MYFGSKQIIIPLTLHGVFGTNNRIMTFHCTSVLAKHGGAKTSGLLCYDPTANVLHGAITLQLVCTVVPIQCMNATV